MIFTRIRLKLNSGVNSRKAFESCKLLEVCLKARQAKKAHLGWKHSKELIKFSNLNSSFLWIIEK